MLMWPCSLVASSACDSAAYTHFCQQSDEELILLYKTLLKNTISNERVVGGLSTVQTINLLRHILKEKMGKL